MSDLVQRNSSCRVCKSTALTLVFSLGKTPLANAFLRAEDLEKEELYFPLDVYFCNTCALVQLIDVVSPELLFKDYVYISSTAPSFIAHFDAFAESVFRRFRLGTNSLVADIGSNDGIFLRPFLRLGARVLGIDPAAKIAEMATQNGIETLPAFFDSALAGKLAAERGFASIISCANVLAHMDNLSDFLSGVQAFLDPQGVLVVEVPYLLDLLEKNLFDTVYHEHLSYFSIRPLTLLLERFGFKIFDVERVETHGGSIRIFVQKVGGPHSMQDSVDSFLTLEKNKRLGSAETYRMFAGKIEANKKKLYSLLSALKSEGKRIAGYGAPAKGNTLLNYFKIGKEVLDYIVDDSPWKQGLFTPGMHIPVLSPERLKDDKPDYIFILAWNFAQSIMKKLDRFRSSGTKFIVPMPHPRIL